MPLPLENDTDEQIYVKTIVKTSIKYPPSVKNSNLVVTFLNGISINDYGSKHQGHRRIKKKVQELTETYALNPRAFMNLIPPFMYFGQQIKT